jgi:hypothetical protein
MPKKSHSTTLTVSLAILTGFIGGKASAISLDDIQLWAGSGTNRAALVIEWSVPQSLTNSSVPLPVADKALVWGYRFNGAASGTQMLEAILAADPKLYVAEDGATAIAGIGYNLAGNGVLGITDGTRTNFFANGWLTNATVNMDAAQSLNAGDLYWSGAQGPQWETWRETNELGGFDASPNRGPGAYWTATDTNFATGFHGQWQLSSGLDEAPLVDGSWVGLSVAAGEYESATNAACKVYKHAPVSPDGTYVAYVCNTNDFAVQVISTNILDSYSPYNDPTAVLNRPTLQFFDPFGGSVTDRVSIIDDPYNVAPGGGNVITEIKDGGEITVQLGRRIYDNPNNPYGIDLIVYGNSFFTGVSGGSGAISDSTDLSVASLTSSAIYGHATVVSVSQDGTNWIAFPSVAALFPDNAYRWDDTNNSWTAEEMNPTKPLNPILYTNDFGGETIAWALDQFAGAAGGTGFTLQGTGLPWIQYLRVEPSPGNYTVIDAIAAVNPAVVGDALCIAPDNLALGMTNLDFQNPGNACQNQIAIHFDSVSEVARISTVSLSDFSPFAPVAGAVSSACQIQSRPVAGTCPVNFQAELALRAGAGYTGDGNDLRVYQWNCTHWISQPFGFNATNDEVLLSGITNFSAFVISQIIPPSLSIRSLTNGFAFQFAPVPNCTHILERSADLITWTPVFTNTAVGPQSMALPDTNAPAGNAFYRLRVNVP